MTTHHCWQPLLEGHARDQALAVVQEIAIALQPHSLQGTVDATAENTPYRLGLGYGLAGIALFYAYLARTGLQPEARDLAEAYLDEAIEGPAQQVMIPALFNGFTGIAWAHAHVRQRLFGERHRGSLTAIDEALITLVRRWQWPAKFDVLLGLSGIGVYALDRLPQRAGHVLVELIVQRLDELGEHQGEQRAWFTPPEGIAHIPEGEFCFGMAHGTAGVMAFLARAAVAVPTVTAQASRMLEAATAFVLTHQLASDVGAGLPAWMSRDGQPSGPARLAWCYGAPGIAAALLAAARLTGHQKWESEAVHLALGAHARSSQHNRVMDATLCHGAAGVAHTCNRLAQATGDVRLAEVARHWFRRTLDEFRQPEQGVAGFLPYGLGHAEVDEVGTSAPEPGLLLGAAGIGLALLAATTPIEPAWDRLFMLDVHRAKEKV